VGVLATSRDCSAPLGADRRSRRVKAAQRDRGSHYILKKNFIPSVTMKNRSIATVGETLSAEELRAAVGGAEGKVTNAKTYLDWTDKEGGPRCEVDRTEYDAPILY
jgi:hypothetical protein